MSIYLQVERFPIVLKFGSRLSRNTTVPLKFQNDTIVFKTNLVDSRLDDFIIPMSRQRSVGKIALPNHDKTQSAIRVHSPRDVLCIQLK